MQKLPDSRSASAATVWKKITSVVLRAREINAEKKEETDLEITSQAC